MVDGLHRRDVKQFRLGGGRVAVVLEVILATHPAMLNRHRLPQGTVSSLLHRHFKVLFIYKRLDRCDSVHFAHILGFVRGNLA